MGGPLAPPPPPILRLGRCIVGLPLHTYPHSHPCPCTPLPLSIRPHAPAASVLTSSPPCCACRMMPMGQSGEPSSKSQQAQQQGKAFATLPSPPPPDHDAVDSKPFSDAPGSPLEVGSNAATWAVAVPLLNMAPALRSVSYTSLPFHTNPPTHPPARPPAHPPTHPPTCGSAAAAAWLTGRRGASTTATSPWQKPRQPMRPKRLRVQQRRMRRRAPWLSPSHLPACRQLPYLRWCRGIGWWPCCSRCVWRGPGGSCST